MVKSKGKKAKQSNRKQMEHHEHQRNLSETTVESAEVKTASKPVHQVRRVQDQGFFNHPVL